MTADEAWDFLKAKILVIFEGEDVRVAVEDLNRLVAIHIQKCVQRHAPSIIIEDLNELLQTGFLSLNHTLRAVPDERLVPHLVNMWLFVFGKVLGQSNPQCDGTFGITGGPNGGPCYRTGLFGGGVTASVSLEFPRRKGRENDVF
jgi:hypothetical protein